MVQQDDIPQGGEIIGRLRELVRRSGLSQAQFSRRLGIDPSNLSKVIAGRLPVGLSLVNRLVADMGVSKLWLLAGTGNPEEQPAREGAPVYDIDITAGAVELSRAFTEDRIMGHISLPDLDSRYPVVRVSGDSMRPTINDGSYISIRRVDPAGTIFWGQIYVVVLDDYRMVKIVRRNRQDDSRVILHSVNTAYDDIDVARDEIRAMFVVETVVNIDRRC